MQHRLSGGHAKTLEAVDIILKQGGNAVDAAIAAYYVSFISEPCMASMGAGGFAMVNDLKSIQVVDFFCQTPLQKRKTSDLEFYPITVDFGNATEDFHVGKGSIAVPGAIAGIFALYERWGTMPMKELVEPAIKWSKEGIALDRFQAYDFSLLEQILGIDADMNSVFFHQNGILKQEGDKVIMHQYPELLDALWREGKDLVYKGEIAQKVADDLSSEGHLQRADFESYKVNIAKANNFNFFNRTIHTPNFPSVGGMLITAILNNLQDQLTGKQIDPLSIEQFQLLVDVFSKVGNLKNDPKKISNYLMDQFGISMPTIISALGKKWGGTSHFNVIDKNGMTVGLTTSIGEGSGYFVPGTDMQLNNMLGEEALMPNGFHNWNTNERLQSMMSPTLISDNNGKTVMTIGSGGAGRIPYMISQVILNSCYFNQCAKEAVESPRIYLSNRGIEVEKGFEVDSMNIPNVFTWNDASLYFGGTHVIERIGKEFIPVADHRRYGAII